MAQRSTFFIRRAAEGLASFVLLLACCASARAEAMSAAGEPVSPNEPAAQAPWPQTEGHWARRASRDLARVPPSTPTGWMIVQLPSEAAPGARQRIQHALSMPSETPRAMLRSIGIDATGCATRLRMPAKFKRDADGGRSLQVDAHLGLACSF